VIEWDNTNGIAVLRMKHGPVNALDVDLLAALADGITEIEKSDAEALVLTGEGVAFSAGADLYSVLEGGASYIDGAVPHLSRCFSTLFKFPRPAVAAVNGHAIAGGCVLTCACDYRIMAEGESRIGVSELRVGVPYPTWALEIVRFAAAPQHIQEIVYLARSYLPNEALAKGLVDEIVPPDKLMDRAMEIATRLAAIPPDSFTRAKRQLRAPTISFVENYAPGNDDDVRLAWQSSEITEAIRAFLKKTLGSDARS
jgi:enoyl-CoA hydratase